MCIQLRQTGVLCVYNSIDDSIGMNRWQHGKDTHTHTHTHIVVMEITALHNVTQLPPLKEYVPYSANYLRSGWAHQNDLVAVNCELDTDD